ncbi:uracil-DNA glycosylase [Mesorhizobium sp. L-8-10]|uniref:uracil-DNA glycosylase n=1 Tax=Mesorhizobium sp. L-8-10 TaxID=2744523 RepID=UPI00192844D2|nr:uracil-DNA glycosylase [Mesorhizobium sp. L-8-10]
MKTPRDFVAALAELDLPDVFNPYRDCCPVHDRSDASRLRTANFVQCLEAALDARVDTIWIARDLGYRGGRRTGVPLTDEVHLSDAGQLLGGVSLRRATRGPVVAERTAAIVWRMLTRISEPVVLWNVFPLHPHESGDPFSNRCHTRKERDTAWPFLIALIEMIRPRRMVAIGRDAGAALVDFEIPVITVRHPSYGGQSDFIAGLQTIYGLNEGPIENRTLELPF